MEKYKWNKKKLEKKLYELCKRFDEVKKEKILIKEDIENLEQMIFNVKLKKSNLLEQYNCDLDSYKGFKKLWKYFHQFYEFTQTNKIKYSNPKKIIISNDELLSLTHDFYKYNLNDYFFNEFLKQFKKRSDHLEFEKNKNNNEALGITTPLNTSNESFIKIYKKNTIEDLYSLIHEYMHAIAFNIDNNTNYGEKIIFSEIYPLFIEITAKDYFEKIFNNGESITINILNYNDYSDLITYVIQFLDLMSYEAETKPFSSIKELKDACKKVSISKKEINKVLFEDYEIYIISYMYAIELYHIYKKDKDKSLELLKKIILTSKNNTKDYIISIKDLGFIPNMHLSSYYEELKNDYNKVKKLRK